MGTRPKNAPSPSHPWGMNAAQAKALKVAAWVAAMRCEPGAFVPIRVDNPLNNRRHWRVVSRSSKAARTAIRNECAWAGLDTDTPCVVTMTRYGPGVLDEGCGLNASLKPIRDGVADYLELKDNSPLIRWVYRQEKAPQGCYGVRVTIETVKEPA